MSMAAHPHSSGTIMRPRWSIATKLALLVVFAVTTSAAIAAMRAIASIPDLKHARIELVDGTMLASLGSATRLDSDIRLTDGSAALSPLAVLHSGTIEVSVPIVNAGLEVGHFSVIADTSDLADQLLASLGMTFAGAAIALAVGLLIAWQLQRGITAPLRQLTGAVSEIRETHDYTARVAAAGADEVGILVGGFNAMLGEIEEREGRLEAHRRNLEADVLDRTHDLRIAKDAAESASVAKSDFLAVMSHEIRTPMNGIMVMAELLAAADLPDRQRRYAEVISKSGQSLLAIINDILDFSKVESGKLELERIAVHPAEIVDTVVTLFGERAQSKGLDLAAYVAPGV